MQYNYSSSLLASDQFINSFDFDHSFMEKKTGRELVYPTKSAAEKNLRKFSSFPPVRGSIKRRMFMTMFGRLKWSLGHPILFRT
jgi:hypothetical protein